MIDFACVEKALRQQTFGTLSTLTERGTPHATGVVYAVSARDEALALYVTTRTTTRKVRNIGARHDVAFVVPVPHRLLPLLPPRAMTMGRTGPLSRRGSSAGSLPRSGGS
jgi:nitroimidazol reductase NimA-like FMN-containing flavoprotein (pyridoxamine 5'-phosphate oxidase superfamily)